MDPPARAHPAGGTAERRRDRDPPHRAGGCRAHEPGSRGRAGAPLEAGQPAAPRSRCRSALFGGHRHVPAVRVAAGTATRPPTRPTAPAPCGSTSAGTTSTSSSSGSARVPRVWRSSAPPRRSHFTPSTSPCATPQSCPRCSGASWSDDENGAEQETDQGPSSATRPGNRRRLPGLVAHVNRRDSGLRRRRRWSRRALPPASTCTGGRLRRWRGGRRDCGPRRCPMTGRGCA